MRSAASSLNYFDRARAWAGVMLLAAGVAAITGSLLDWVSIDAPGQTGDEFAQHRVLGETNTEPFSGVDANDGWWTLGAGVVLLASAALLVARKKALYAWLGFVASVVIGAVAIADFRGIENLASRMRIIGDARPALGITLVAASAIVGLIASVAGVAASPRAQ